MPLPRCLRKLRAAFRGKRAEEQTNTKVLLEPSAKASGKQKAGQTTYKTLTLYRPVIWENNHAPKFSPIGARLALQSGRIVSVDPSSPAAKCVNTPLQYFSAAPLFFSRARSLRSLISGRAFSASTRSSTSTADRSSLRSLPSYPRGRATSIKSSSTSSGRCCASSGRPRSGGTSSRSKS